jgi:hypothetical protein
MADYIHDPKPNTRVTMLAYSLWFITTVLSVFVFTAGRQMIIRTYTRFVPWDAWRVSAGQGGLSLVNIMISLPLAMLVIAIVIGGFEFQHRNAGKAEAWQMLARILAVEFGFLLLALFL